VNRRLRVFQRLFILSFLIIFLFCQIKSPQIVLTSGLSSENSLSSDFYILALEEVNFTLSLNDTEITRGVDNLFLFFTLSFLNGSPIPGNTMIYYNITYEDSTLIKTDEIVANETTSYEIKVDKKIFYSQLAGNYTIQALANGSYFAPISQIAKFVLDVLPSGQVEMTFVNNKISLKRNEITDVDFEIINVGGSTVTNVTISPSDREGTRETPVIYLPNLNLILESGASYQGVLRFFTDTPLYQIHTYQLSFINLGEPDNPVYVLSDPLYLICYPNMTISNVNFPINATVHEKYSISYDITNYEINTIMIQQHIQCGLIPFDEVNSQTFGVSAGPSPHHFIFSAIAIEAGNTTIDLEILIEWTTQSGLKWYSAFYYSGIYRLQVLPDESKLDPFDPIITVAILLITLFFGVGYFSRDVIKGIVGKSSTKQEKVFPETTYPYDVVIIDGSNVAWEEKDQNGHPKLENIEAMINKLSRANFKKIVTVADAALRYQIDNQRRLDRLVKEGAIKMLPARVDGDKFILRIAEEETAMIVSNDLFKEFRDIAPWIDERRIPFTILDGEVFLHPTAEKPSNNKNVTFQRAFET